MSDQATLPESLACKPNIPWESQTIAQLRAERDYWAEQARGVPGFASASAADKYRQGCEAWLARRIREAPLEVIVPWATTDGLGPFCYLASPFTHYRLGHDRAVADIARIAGHLMLAGVKLFCPVAHSAALTQYGKLDPIDAKLWHDINAPFVAACHVLIVAQLEGWDHSTGIADETVAFHARGAPIFDLCPKSLVMTRRA